MPIPLGFGLGELTSGALSGKVSGVISDLESGEPVVDCNVMVLGTSICMSTNANGHDIILNLPPRMYDLRSSMVGYL